MDDQPQNLTVQEAYGAMYAFLDNIWRETESDELGGLLGSMSVLPDGKFADPSIWPDWLEAVRAAKQDEVDLSLGLPPI